MLDADLGLSSTEFLAHLVDVTPYKNDVGANEEYDLQFNQELEHRLSYSNSQGPSGLRKMLLVRFESTDSREK
jgi:hypothetical protein